MPDQPPPRLRVAGRVVLLDAADHVLLVHEREGNRSHWLVPGGGLEPGETPVRAAVRELAEETGLHVLLAADAPSWHVERSIWTIDGTRYDQTNHFYLARTAERCPQVRPTSLTAYERSVTLGSRWWSLADLLATTDDVRPRELVRLLVAELG